MSFRRIISITLAVLTVSSLFASCNVPDNTGISLTASAGCEQYIEFLKERLGADMPDDVVIAVGDDTVKYGADMSDFKDSEGYTVRANDGNLVILGKTEASVDRAVRQFANYGNNGNYSFTYGEGYRVKKLTVMGNDISEYAIVRADNIGDSYMDVAAKELSVYIEKTCGVKLPVYTESEYGSADDRPGRTISMSIDYPNLGDEGFTIDVKPDGNAEILGGRYRGCLYGVYDLLRDIGWRFTSDSMGEYIEYLYESELVDLTEDIDRTEMPKVANRKYHDGGQSIGANRNSLKLKLYGNENEYGFVVPAVHGLHSVDFGDLFDHTQGSQPCFTDEDILQAIENSVIKQVQDKLDAGQVIGRELTYVDVAQFDTQSFCQCSTCMEVLEEEGATAGAVLRMTNRMADAVAERFSPEISALMLAYAGTTKAPKVTRPRENVKIAYCFYVDRAEIDCTKHSINDDGCGQSYFSETFDGWAEICPSSNIQIWYYPLNAYDTTMTAPIISRIYDDMKYLTDNSIDCIMVCAHSSNGLINHALPNYLCALLAWDPDITRDEFGEIVREWYFIVYGESGEYLYEYQMMCEEAGQLKTVCWSSFHKRSVMNMLDSVYMTSNTEYMWELYDRAAAVSETSRHAELVDRCMAGMMYVTVGLNYEDKYVNGTEAERELLAKRHTLAYNIFSKYRLCTYDDFILTTYLDMPLDLEKNPFDYWHTTRLGG